jgi:hypothetical protein
MSAARSKSDKTSTAAIYQSQLAELPKASEATSSASSQTTVSQDDLVKGVIALYADYVERCVQSNKFDYINYLLDDLAKLAQIKPQDFPLEIALPLDSIRDIYQKTGLIQLRPVNTADKLLLGCGNGPCCTTTTGDHSHTGFITINPVLSMNPCVVAAFGIDQGLNQILPPHFYKELYSEAVTIADHLEDLPQDTFNCMSPSFKVFELNDPRPAQLASSNLFWKADGPATTALKKLLVEESNCREQNNEMRIACNEHQDLEITFPKAENLAAFLDFYQFNAQTKAGNTLTLKVADAKQFLNHWKERFPNSEDPHSAIITELSKRQTNTQTQATHQQSESSVPGTKPGPSSSSSSSL